MIEEKLSLLIAAIEANTAALNAVLAAGGEPTNVVPIEAPKKAGRPPKAAPASEPEPAAAEEVEEKPTKVPVSETKPEEFSDPIDKDMTHQGKAKAAPTIDTDAVIKDCVDSFKVKMTEATDPDRKAYLKTQFQVLRDKWGLVGDSKLITLAPTPEKLVGLLADIKAL